MGSALAGVEVSSFLLGNYSVTQEEWQHVRLWAERLDHTIRPDANYFKDPTYPVGVNWYDAILWCNAKSVMEGLRPFYRPSDPIYELATKDAVSWENSEEFNQLASYPVLLNPEANGYRLPTEAEREWAARGGRASQGYKFAGSNNVDEVAWYCSNSRQSMHPSGKKAPNELGLYDMSGNQFEWCWDLAEGSTTYHRIRGGSWCNFPAFCTVTARCSSFTFNRVDDIGVRLARNL